MKEAKDDGRNGLKKNYLKIVSWVEATLTALGLLGSLVQLTEPAGRVFSEIMTNVSMLGMLGGMFLITRLAVRKDMGPQTRLSLKAACFLFFAGFLTGFDGPVFDPKDLSISLPLTAIALLIAHSGWKKDKARKIAEAEAAAVSPVLPALPDQYEYVYKGRYAFDEAGKEYRKRFGIPEYVPLSDEQNKEVMSYAMMPVAYFLYWAIMKNCLKPGESLRPDDIERCRNREITPLQLLSDKYDYVLTNWDFVPELEWFMRAYLDGEMAAMIGSMNADYLAEIQNPDDYMFCVDFSWDRCDRLCGVIEDKYRQAIGVILEEQTARPSV